MDNLKDKNNLNNFEDVVVENSTIEENVKIYKGAEVKNSFLEKDVSIGNHTIIQDSIIKSNSALNRRNYILRSKIGNYTYTGMNTVIRSADIGNFCSISWNVSIGGGNHDYTKLTTSLLSRFYMLDSENQEEKREKELQKTFKNMKPCLIGNDVLISSNVTILRNLKIGNGAVIGAGAVVTKDVEPYSIVVGVPARTIKKRFDDKTISILEEIKWWDWPKDIIRENLDLIYSTVIDDQAIEKLRAIYKKL
ncbi:MAG: hypothetical protein WC928_02690 [Patescibacteria group bacterium]|jgi:acetyltransferase-like isoleucine patch superfamily enzyme